MDWIRSPAEVPIPTHRERSPWLLAGAAGSTSVAVDCLMYVLEDVGPVLKYGPLAACAVAAPATRAERIWRAEGILVWVDLQAWLDAAYIYSDQYGVFTCVVWVADRIGVSYPHVGQGTQALGQVYIISRMIWLRCSCLF